MARLTVGKIKDRAQQHLGDDLGETFNRQTLHYALETAWEDLADAFILHQVPAVEVRLIYTLPPLTTMLDPEAAELNNFGPLLLMQERPSGSTGSFSRVQRVSVLPDWTPSEMLGVYQESGDKFWFIGATQTIDLRFTYQSTSAPSSIYDDAAVVGFENVGKYLAWQTAAIAGPPKGYAIAGWSEEKAKGALYEILVARVRALQDMPRQQPAYHIESAALGPILPWLVLDDGGLFSDAFSDIFD
jgi:hypothetical protein